MPTDTPRPDMDAIEAKGRHEDCNCCQDIERIAAYARSLEARVAELTARETCCDSPKADARPLLTELANTVRATGHDYGCKFRQEAFGDECDCEMPELLARVDTFLASNPQEARDE